MTEPEEGVTSLSPAEWYDLAVKQAQAGDRDMAEKLLAEFAAIADLPANYDEVNCVSTPLARYVATCIHDWIKRDLNAKDAPWCFNVERPAHRQMERSGIDVRARRAYMLLMARGKGKEAALSGAAASSGHTENQVRHLVEAGKDEIWAGAMLAMSNRTRKRVANPPRKKYQKSGSGPPIR